jgi:hypothetical protein
MRKAALWLGIFVAQLVFAAPVQAAEDLLFGQQHYYTVTMRGNGEAIVTARLLFSNTGDKALSTFSFEIPGLKVGEIAGYQQQVQGPCTSYGGSNTGTIKTTPQTTTTTRECLKYAEPDYLSPVYGGTSTYDKLKIKDEGSGKYSVTLPKPVEVEKSSALLLSYTGQGYATNRLLSYGINFQTIKVSERVKLATVGLDVDTGLYLLDGKSKVNYSSEAADQSVSAGASARQLDSVAYSIGKTGTLTEEAKDLAAGESLSVKGTYADAAWKLHPWRILFLVVLGLAVLGLLLWLWRRARRVPTVVAAAEPAPKPKAVAKAVPAETASKAVAFADPLFIAAGVASAAALGLLTWGSLASTELYNYEDEFSRLLTVILFLMGYALALVGPAVWVGARRRDWRAGLYTFVWQVVWLVVLLLVYQVGIRPLLEDAKSVSPMPAYDSIKAGSSSGSSSGAAPDVLR